MSVLVELHNARKERLARMSARAFQKKPVLTLVPKEPIEKVPEPTWADRQAKLWAAREPTFKVVPSKIDRLRKYQEASAKHYGVTLEDLLSPCQKAFLAFPRQVAIYIVMEMLPELAVREVGRRFGRDHATMAFAVRKIKSMLDGDPEFAREIETIKEAAQCL